MSTFAKPVGNEPTRDAAAVSEFEGSTAQESINSTPLLEWIVAGFGLVLLLGVLSLLLADAWVNRGAAADVAVEVESTTRVANGYRTSFKAINRGGETAAGVVIEGEIRRNGGMVERSWITLDYLPAGSEKQGAFFFTEDPRRFELTIRALGYEKP